MRVFVQPRRTQRKAAKKPLVVVTRAVLEPLFEMTLVGAARALGVGTTALKSACRKLGLRGWPYRRSRDLWCPPLCGAEAAAELAAIERFQGMCAAMYA